MCIRLEGLKKAYDKIYLRHYVGENKNETRVVLLKNNRIKYGIAKCNPEDSFSKKEGRLRALDRAHKSDQEFIYSEKEVAKFMEFTIE